MQATERGAVGLDGEYEVDTVKVEILAVHPKKPLVAFRRIASEAYDSGVRCEYPGMTDGDGFELGTYDVERGQTVASWWIYVPGHQRHGPCTPYETGARRLADAEAALASLGLDLTRPPREVALRDVGLRVAEPSALAPEAWDLSDWKALWLGDRELYVRTQMHSMGTPKITFPAAYLLPGGRALVVDCAATAHMRGGDKRCAVSPPLPTRAAP